MVRSANATTSLVTVKTANSALAMEDANAMAVAAMKAGAEVLASAAHQLTSAQTLRARSVQDMESACAVAASAKKTRTADIQESFVKSARLVPTVALS